MEQIISDLGEEVSSLTTQLKKNKLSSQVLQVKYDKAQEDITELEKKLISTETMSSEQAHHIIQMTNEHADEIQELDSLNTQLEEYKSHNETLQQQLDSLNTTLKKSKTFQKQLDSLNTQLEESKSHNGTLQQQLDSLNTQLEESKSHNGTLQQQLNSLNTQLEESKSQNSKQKDTSQLSLVVNDFITKVTPMVQASFNIAPNYNVFDPLPSDSKESPFGIMDFPTPVVPATSQFPPQTQSQFSLPDTSQFPPQTHSQFSLPDTNQFSLLDPLPLPEAPQLPDITTTSSPIVQPHKPTIRKKRPLKQKGPAGKRRKYGKDFKNNCSFVIDSVKWKTVHKKNCHRCVQSNIKKVFSCDQCDEIICKRCVYGAISDLEERGSEETITDLYTCPACQGKCFCTKCIQKKGLQI